MMYWQDSIEDKKTYRVTGDTLDICFRVSSVRLPVDHAWSLCASIHHKLPWILNEEHAGIHLIHGAESGNGWYRPENEDYLLLSKRTRLNIRIPATRRADILKLTGTTLTVDDCSVKVGDATEKLLIPSTTIFSRHVNTREVEDEDDFLSDVADQIKQLGIVPRKMLCGKLHSFRSPNGSIKIRSLMIADLELDESVSLQQHGIGPFRAFGMGLFLPHKGIDAVYKKADD